MKNILLFVAVLFSGSVFAQCSAGFFSSNSGLTVAFTNTSTGIMYNWSFGDGGTSTQQDPVHSYSASGTYSVMLIAADTSGCSDTIVNNITVIATYTTTISGMVYAAGSPVSYGIARTYKINGSGIPMTLESQDTIVSGSFTSGITQQGNYIIVAMADTVNYPNYMATFFGDTIYWQDATIITHGQVDTTIGVTINLKELPVWTTGTGYCSGSIYFDSFQRSGPGRAGDPIPGLDISLEQIPGGIKANTTTDENGFFEIKNIPMNTQYDLLVSFPGIEMSSTHNIQINATTDTVVNLNFGVDTAQGAATIFAAAINTSVLNLSNEELINIYPNPASGQITVQLDPKTSSTIEIYNSLGMLVLKEKSNGVSGKKLDISAFPNGNYHVKVIEKSGTKAVKFVKN